MQKEDNGAPENDVETVPEAFLLAASTEWFFWATGFPDTKKPLFASG